MNRRELKDRLVAARVPEGDYFIVGIDSQLTPGKGGGFGELGVAPASDGPGWRLFTGEHGRVRGERVFATEDEACQKAWELLDPGSRPPLRPRTVQERAAAQERACQMIAEYQNLGQQQAQEPGED